MTSRIDLLPNLARTLNMRRGRLMIALASLALFWACYPTADTTYSNPQEFGTGQWLVEFRTGETVVQMEIAISTQERKRYRLQQSRLHIDPSAFSGLSRDQAMSAARTFDFN
jgi:hypothetical protein